MNPKLYRRWIITQLVGLGLLMSVPVGILTVANICKFSVAFLLMLAACSAPGPTPEPTQGIAAPVVASPSPVGTFHTHCSFGGGPVLNCTLGSPTPVPATGSLVPPASPTTGPYPGPNTPTPTVRASPSVTRVPSITPTRAPTLTPTNTLTPTATLTPTTIPTEVPSPTSVASPRPTITPAPTPIPGVAILPYPSAPLCPDWGDLHNTDEFHTLWDSVRGCHYDHEHGADPYTAAVAAKFPAFNLLALNCGHEVNNCSPSSVIENVAGVLGGKHEGFKIDVNLNSYAGCFGFEGAPIGIDAAVIGYHSFGNYAREIIGRFHSAYTLVRECKVGAPNDFGYAYIPSLQDYGQRTIPYQGDIMPFADTPIIAYDPPRGPYISMDCVGTKNSNTPPERGVCRESLAFVLSHNANANSIWTSKKTGGGVAATAGSGNNLFRLLFRIRDTFQLLGWNAYRALAEANPPQSPLPFKFWYLCSNDGGLNFAPIPGCRYNNSTSKVQELWLSVPAAWDNVAGLDTDSRVGRFSGQFMVSKFGDLMPAGVCLQPNLTCYPVKYVNAFVGIAGTQLIDGKFPQFSMEGQPERDIGFCGNVVCTEGSPGYRSSGWIGPNN